MNPRREKPLKPDQDIPTSSSIVPIHLLLVEDNPGDVRLVHEMLRDQAHIKLEVADCLAACLGRLAQGGIDLVLLDLGLRDSQGLDTLTSVAQTHPALPIVALTGLDDDAMALRAVQAGGQDYLTKNTITLEILRRTIRHAFERKRVEFQIKTALEALRKSEENFRCSLEDSPLGVRVATAKGETIYANKAILEIYGYESIDEFNGIPIKERYTSQSYAEFQLRKKARDRGDFGPSEYEINIVRKNKEIRHLQVLRKEVLWNGIKKFQVIYQDISERKRAEAALRESEERYRAMMEQAADAVFVHDETGRILDVNRKTCQNLGYSREELLSKSIGDIDPEAIQTKKNELWGKILAGEQFTFESCQMRKDGSVIPVEVILGSVHLPLGPAVLGLVRDITERKRIEAALRESEEKYRTLFTSSSDAIMLIEPFSGKFISGNQTTMAILGLKNDDDFSSFGPWDFSPERQPDERASAEKAKEMNEIAMRDGSNFFEWSHKRLNGEEFSTNVRLTRMVLDKKTILQATVRDITNRKKAEEKIRNSLVEKEVLLKEVHHRVKNNLMIIIGLIKMQEAKADNEMFNPLLQELEGRIRSMALVHESLYKSKDLAHVDLQNYIETMSAQIHAQFGADRDIRFSVQAAGVDVNLDSTVSCGLILNELLTNAFKHGFPDNRPGSGAGNCEINVIVNQEGGMNVLTVADNGVGLPSDLDWEKSDTLGLRLIKMLSKQINGSIELDRSAGTAFRLKFPVADKIH